MSAIFKYDFMKLVDEVFGIKFGPEPEYLPEWSLMDRARSLVKVTRDQTSFGARGTFVCNPFDPTQDCITIPPDVHIIEETVVLAHELGHAENSRFERDRYLKVLSEITDWRFYGQRPSNPERIVEEEIRANERGRRHIVELHPELLSYYDHEMEGALEACKFQLASLPPRPEPIRYDNLKFKTSRDYGVKWTPFKYLDFI